MLDVYEKGFRRMATVDELPIGQPRVYRSGGAFILLLRSRFGVRAADVTRCISADAPTGRGEALAAVAECLNDGDVAAIDWQAAIDEQTLPLEVRDDAVWVCVDECGDGG